MRSNCGYTGFTLLEVLVTIVVLAIAGSALVSVYTNLIARSADPIIQEQALAIAEAYMEEIRLKPFNDPDGVDGEGSRALYDDVDDYNGLIDVGATDQTGTAVGGLNDYTVDVDVTGVALATIGAANSLRIDIEVSHPAINPIRLKSFRVNY